jgi:cytochrome b subunit of formate dehydrogenase
MFTRKNYYFLFFINEIFARLEKAKIFTKFDIRQVFNRIRIDPDSEELTTFRTRYNSYKYKVLFFGLINSLVIYQRYINDVLFNYFNDFCTTYLNDILIYLDNVLEYNAQVKRVF